MVYRVLGRVFSQVRYLVFGVGITFLVLSVSLLLPNVGAITQVFGTAGIGWQLKAAFLLSLYGSLFTNFSFLSAFNLLLVALFFGINITLLVYYIRRQQTVSRNTGMHMSSLGGLVSGLFGIGCAACGSVIITSLLGMFGASGLILLLPFKGAEFGLLGVILLVTSIWYLINKINDPLVCRLHSSRTTSVDGA